MKSKFLSFLLVLGIVVSLFMLKDVLQKKNARESAFKHLFLQGQSFISNAVEDMETSICVNSHPQGPSGEFNTWIQPYLEKLKYDQEALIALSRRQLISEFELKCRQHKELRGYSRDTAIFSICNEHAKALGNFSSPQNADLKALTVLSVLKEMADDYHNLFLAPICHYEYADWMVSGNMRHYTVGDTMKLEFFMEEDKYPTCWRDMLSSVRIKDSTFLYQWPMWYRDFYLQLQPGLKRVEVPITIRYKHQGENKVMKRHYTTRTDNEAYGVE